jgi:hypothetical protein
LLEQVAKRMKKAPFWARGLAYTGVIYAAEYSSGWLLRRGTGKCPWDYSGSGRDVHGLVRLDYAPAWYALGLLFEPLHAAVTALEQPGAAADSAEIPASPEVAPVLPVAPVDQKSEARVAQA